MPGRRRSTVLACVILALGAPASAQAADLFAIVGPDTTIVLRDAQGQRVTQLEPGEYRITVDDRSDFHNFHLAGPGVDFATEVEQVGTVVWNVTFVDGIYTFQCDPHRSEMNGIFAVGTAQLPPPPAPAPPAPVRRLVATVGPGATIALTFRGRRVTRLARGAYTIVVRDRSRAHNFHLVGPRLNRKTTVRAVGTFTWRVTLRRGTFRFLCDAHPTRMRRSFTVR